MKTIKKILSVAVSLMMVFSLMTVVNATNEETKFAINAPGTNHTYEVYQIFTGNLSTNEKGEKVLSNVVAGQNFKSDKSVEDALEAFGKLTGSEAQRAAAIADYVNLTNPLATVAGGNSVYVVPGYYLIKDQADTVGTDDAFTLYIIQVVGPVTLNAKTGKPKVEKKVLENSNNEWQDGADYNIGDDVPFKLTATIGENIDKFDTYYLRFNDTLSKGLTLNASSIKVSVSTTQGTTQLSNDKYYIYGDQNVFQVVIYDLKTVGVNVEQGTKVIVEYTAKLNDLADIGNPGNPNEVTLTYSNNPNVTTPTTPSNPENPGTPEKPTNPETPDEPKHPETPNQPDNPGETPKDVVVVFTYELDVNKVNEAKEPLKGAGFTLYKGDVAIGEEIKGTDLTTFKWEGLDAGTYTLKETTTPEGYNTVKDITFEIVGTYENPSDNSVLTKLVVKANGEVVSEGDKATFTADIASGVVATNVVNQSGSTLPSTGGMGTTMLYVGGSILMLGAAILLVSKKRMEA